MTFQPSLYERIVAPLGLFIPSFEEAHVLGQPSGQFRKAVAMQAYCNDSGIVVDAVTVPLVAVTTT